MKYTLAALAALTVGANAAVIHNLAGSANNQAGFTATSGFTFTTGALGAENLLSTIDVAGPNTGALATVYGLEVYVDADNDASTFGLGALVASSTNTTALSNGFAISALSFNNEVLADNQSYMVVFTDGLGTPVTSRFGLVNGATDAGTTSFSNGGAVFAGSHEAAITINTTAVPEPSSTALLGLGGLALILRRRK